MASLLIKNGYIITMDSNDSRFRGDLLIKDHKIQRVAPEINQSADKIIDASGSLVMPDFVQTHVHLYQSLLRGKADDQPLPDWLETITSL